MPSDNINVVSVITPVNGDLEGLARLTRSLIEQTWPYWEMVIVADDDSCYRSRLAELGVEDPRLRFFWTPRAGSGLDVARSIGVYYATGSFLAPLETSSVCRPERLEIMVHMARAHGICGSNLVRLDRAGAVEGSLYPPGNGVRWQSLDCGCGDKLPMDFVFSRELLAQTEHGADGVPATQHIDPRLIPDDLPVPVLETVLQEQHHR